MNKKKVEIGGGLSPREGYLNVDLRKLPSVDVVAPAYKLPFKDGSKKIVYSACMIEHISRAMVIPTLYEWHRVLKVGGKVELVTVDLASLMDNWKAASWNEVLDGIYGAQDYPEDFHGVGFSFDSLSSDLYEAGFSTVELVESYIYRNIPRMTVEAVK